MANRKKVEESGNVEENEEGNNKCGNSEKEGKNFEKIKNIEVPEEPCPQQGKLIIGRSKQPDRFIPVVKTFLEEARRQMTQLREELTEMRQKVMRKYIYLYWRTDLLCCESKSPPKL